VLEPSMENMNYILHPAIYLLNSGAFNRENKSFGYKDWITKPVADVIESFDEERRNIGKKMGINLTPAYEQFNKWYSSSGKDIYEVLSKSKPHSNIDNSYFKLSVPRLNGLIEEDVPFGLVPLCYLGSLLKIEMPTTSCIIELISKINNKNYFDYLKYVSSLKNFLE